LITGESGRVGVDRPFDPRSSPRLSAHLSPQSSNIPTELLESELFGHTRGAFTGAVARKRDCLKWPTAGLIFLDEIGDIPPRPVRLLRVIQERDSLRWRHHARKGGRAHYRRDHIDLKEAFVRARSRGPFYRLSVVPIELPPLRDRREDILAAGPAFHP